MQEKKNLEDDDDLGYYPDGVKRTLTDEQVAMFRHSETYAIIRQSQLQKENNNVGLEEEAVGSVSEDYRSREAEQHGAGYAEAALEVAETPLPLASATKELVRSDDEEEYVRFLEAEKKEMQTEAARKKRKRNGRDLAGRHERAPTHRRLVRELDEVVGDDGLLDYGEEPAVSTSIPRESSQSKTLQIFQGRKPIVYEDEGSGGAVEVPNAPHAGTALPEQGRKIWWPTIGA